MPEYLTAEQEQDLAALVYRFPSIFERARTDWAKFKLGYKYNLFTDDEVAEILDWFKGFPGVWQTVKPNWEAPPLQNKRLVNEIEAWIGSTYGFSPLSGGLGIAPLIIAGILIAAALGIGGAVYAVGYVQRQRNISEMIDGVVSGKIPIETLNDAIRQESAPGFFGEVKGLIVWGIVGLVFFTLWPQIRTALKKEKA